MQSELIREFRDGELVPGTRYRVVRLVGSGGMGSVYEVEHTELGKRFVLKALLRDLSRRKDLVARLRQEWRALARLEHPCIVNVTDAGTSDNGVPFYVMERLDGETLSDRLRRETRLPAPEALMVAAGVLDGLSAAHEIGIVHRDVKPPNIIVLVGGGVKLLDFGIAKIASSSAEVITARGVAIGTPRYMSPEQARGDRVDGRADLYAAGLILFEMIAGSGPFDDVADANELLLAHLSKAPPRLASLAEGVPPELDQIVASLLEKDPRARPPSARRVAEALRQIAARLGAVAPPRAGYPSQGSVPPARPSGPPAERTRPASPRASAQFDATVPLPGPAPDATVPSEPADATLPSGPPGADTTVLDPKRTVRLDEMPARHPDPSCQVAAAPTAVDGATSPSLPEWHADAGRSAVRPGSVRLDDRTLTLEELGERPRPVIEPPPTRTAVPAATGGGTPPPVESERPPSLDAGPRRGALAAVSGLAGLLIVGLLGAGAWTVLWPHDASAVRDEPSGSPPASAPAARRAARQEQSVAPGAVPPPSAAAPAPSARAAVAAAPAASPTPPPKSPAPAAKPGPTAKKAARAPRPHRAPGPAPAHRAPRLSPPAGMPGSGL